MAKSFDPNNGQNQQNTPPNANQPYHNQPNANQPYNNQPNNNQQPPFNGQQYPNRPHPGQPPLNGAPYPYPPQPNAYHIPLPPTRAELREKMSDEQKAKLRKRSVLSMALSCSALLLFFMFVAFISSAEVTKTFGVAVTLYTFALITGLGSFALGLTSMLLGIMSERFIAGLSITGIVLGAVAMLCGFIAVITSIIEFSTVSVGSGYYYAFSAFSHILG